ncbi:LOW QUALITY PROTEIN: putative membrane protein, partial [Streptomyces himastatinicus ATCC 53653]
PSSPSGSWDDDARTGIVLACVLTLGASALAGLITVMPSVRRVMGPWWLVPPLVLGAVAAVRWGLLGA